jgi:hypothetical protein
LAVGRVLDKVLENLEYQPSNRLLKHLIPCYSRLSQNRWLVEQFHHLKCS